MDGLPHPGNGMWIKLTVCGVSRLGYGSADGKSGGDAIKEIIGDALRNAAMRFGAALDLWHKGDLHPDPEEPERKPEQPPQQPAGESTQTGTKSNSRELYKRLQGGIRGCKSHAEITRFGKEFSADFAKLPSDWEREIHDEFTHHFLKTGIGECKSRAELQEFGETHADKFRALSSARYAEVRKEYAQKLEARIAAENPPEHERR